MERYRHIHFWYSRLELMSTHLSGEVMKWHETDCYTDLDINKSLIEYNVNDEKGIYEVQESSSWK